MKNSVLYIIIIVLSIALYANSKNTSLNELIPSLKKLNNSFTEDVNVEHKTNLEFSDDNGEFTDERDNKTYKWVKIGKQIWMSENLAYDTKTEGCYCFENDKFFKGFFGCLYTWNTALKVVPKGWHLPSDLEWKELNSYLKENSFSYNKTKGNNGIAMSLTKNILWIQSDNIGAAGNNSYPQIRNKSGFNAIPSGFKDCVRGFHGAGAMAKWWTSTDGDKIGAYTRYIYYNRNTLERGEFYVEDKTNAYSVRCIKDR